MSANTPMHEPTQEPSQDKAHGHSPASESLSPNALFAVLISGALFGFGLTLSTMIKPEVVLSFLRGQDMGLLLVLGSAVMVTFLFYQMTPKQMKQPLLHPTFEKHSVKWERNTFVGAAIFGIGWGISGVCPGPAIAGLGSGYWPLLWSIVGLAIGAGLQGWFAKQNANP